MPLSEIHDVNQLRGLAPQRLPELCADLRRFVVENTKEKAGHIASSLTATEITVALHYVFNTPTDILIWDVGHQAYAHKVITDRKNSFFTNRLPGGISGFTARIESPFDPFGAGHSSTSISAIGGFALAAKLSGTNRKHVAIIGDGALTGGMAYEALNHLGTQNIDVLLVLNDNESSIDPNIGALHEFQDYRHFFESLGWGYSGPHDGSDVLRLVNLFTVEKNNIGTRVIHLKTKKENPAAPIIVQAAIAPSTQSYSDVFGEELLKLATADERIVAISPAMVSSSGLKLFQQSFASRCFDTGITEQHAVTLAAGMAASGFKPVVSIYSTFLQRAIDQIIHDVALQNLPVIFAIDRAGFVGEDGPTHHGVFDLSLLNSVPNLQILAPMDAAELRAMLRYALAQNSPVAIRYPRGEEKINTGAPIEKFTPKLRVLKHGQNMVVLSLGTIGQEVQLALANHPYIGHIDLRTLKPWDTDALKNSLAQYKTAITVEEGTMRGGLRDTFCAWLKLNNLQLNVHSLGVDENFVAHASIAQLRGEAGISAKAIQSFLEKFLNNNLK